MEHRRRVKTALVGVFAVLISTMLASPVGAKGADASLVFISRHRITSIEPSGDGFTKVLGATGFIFAFDVSAAAGRAAYSSFEQPFRTVRLDGKGMREIDLGDEFIDDVAWSPDGKKIAYTLRGPAELWVMDADGTDRSLLAKHESWAPRELSWSPDGTRLVYTACDGVPMYTSCTPWKVFTVGLDGGSPVQLDPAGAQETSPDWSPDGDRIVFRGIGASSSDLFTISPDGTDKVQITSDEGAELGPHWSPSGKHIAFLDEDEDIWVVYADGSNRQEVFAHPRHTAGDLGWSSDGRWITFTYEPDNEENSDSEIALVHRDGSVFRLVTDNGVNDYAAHWVDG